MHAREPRKSILMVFPVVPHPLRAGGEALRYFPIIEYLSPRHDIHIITISHSPVDWTSIKVLEKYCCTVSVIQHTDFRCSRLQKLWTQALLLMPWTPPIGFVRYGDDRITSELRRLTSGICYDVALWVTIRHARHWKTIAAVRHVIDFVDSPTLHTQRRVSRSFNSPILQAYEVWKMRRLEAKILRAMAASIYISPVDARTLPLRTSGARPRHIIPNGVSANRYTSRIHENMKSPSIGFLGNMSYRPNSEAVHWLYHHVFIPLRQQLPALTMYIIGRLPDESIVALGQEEGVVVTGEVEDLWPYINGVDVFIFPIWKGSGLKNKMLEAMYAKRPVVTSPIGAEGIEGLPGRDFIVCESQQDFLHATMRLLQSTHLRSELGEAAHCLVTTKFSWNRLLRDFEKVFLGTD